MRSISMRGLIPICEYRMNDKRKTSGLIDHENNEIRNHYRHPQQSDSLARRIEAVGSDELQQDHLFCMPSGLKERPAKTILSVEKILFN